MGGIAVADSGQIVTTPSVNLQVSEIRLKPIGATISFQTIARPLAERNREASIQDRAQTHPTPIQLDPMTGESDKMLEPPVFAGQDLPQRFADVYASEYEPTKPQFLSIRGFELKSTTNSPAVACEKLQKPGESLDNAKKTMSKDIEQVNSPGAAKECVKPIDSLPLLPVPNGQWVTSKSNDNDHQKRAAQHIELTAPRTISVAQVTRLSTPHAGVSVPAKLASYARYVQTATPQPRVAAPPIPLAKKLSATELMMKEIHDQYPDAQVVLANADGELVVRGICSNRKHATAIIRMIRSRLLIPVDDCLVVQ